MARSRAAKAYVGAVMAGVSAAITAAVPLVDDGLMPSEVLIILGAAITAGAATGFGVYQTRNAPAKPKEVAR
jgi:hypothetical protein